MSDALPIRKKLKYAAAGMLLAMVIGYFLPRGRSGPSNTVVFAQPGASPELAIGWHRYNLNISWGALRTSIHGAGIEAFWAGVDGNHASILVCDEGGEMHFARLFYHPGTFTSETPATEARLSQTLRAQFAGSSERDLSDARLFDWFCNAQGKGEFRKRYWRGDGSTVRVP